MPEYIDTLSSQHYTLLTQLHRKMENHEVYEPTALEKSWINWIYDKNGFISKDSIEMFYSTITSYLNNNVVIRQGKKTGVFEILLDNDQLYIEITKQELQNIRDILEQRTKLLVLTKEYAPNKTVRWIHRGKNDLSFYLCKESSESVEALFYINNSIHFTKELDTILG